MDSGAILKVRRGTSVNAVSIYWDTRVNVTGTLMREGVRTGVVPDLSLLENLSVRIAELMQLINEKKRSLILKATNTEP
jgi:hypothetical protein